MDEERDERDERWAEEIRERLTDQFDDGLPDMVQMELDRLNEAAAEAA